MDPILNPLGTLAAPPKNLAPTTERQPAWVAGQQVDGQQVAGKGQRVAGQQVEDQQVASRDSETEITRVTLTNAVEGREPLKAERFEAGKPVIAFFEAKNSSDQPRTVQVVFEDKAAGTRVGFVKLEIPGKATRWRTWAKTERIRKAGEWTVIIEDETGAALSQTSFTVAGPVMEPVEAKAAPASPDSMPLQSAKSHGESHHGT